MTPARSFAEVAFLESVADGSFELLSLTRADVTRVAELVAQYKDLPLVPPTLPLLRSPSVSA